MIALCIYSPEGHVGKTALCAGIARRMHAEGKKVGYFKPLSAGAGIGNTQAGARDCSFLRETLELSEPLEMVCPARIGEAEARAAKGVPAEVERKVQESFREVSRDKDIVLVEGGTGLGKDSAGAKLLERVFGPSGAKLLVVIQYSGAPVQQDLRSIDAALRPMMIGIVINAVPVNKMGDKAHLVAGLDTTVFGVIPQDRALLGMSVKDLAEAVGARTIISENGTGDIVENVMLGAAGLDHGPVYFGRKTSKAVVVRGERPDMQLAALETPTRCLVLTGGVGPIDAVKRRAQDRKVPIMVVEEGTEAAMGRIEASFLRTTFSYEQKLRRIDELMGQNFDFKALCKALGL